MPSLNSLKDKDEAHVGQLRVACEKRGFEIYLGNVQREVRGECNEDSYGGYHQIDEIIEEDTTLTDVIDSTGLRIIDSMRIDTSNFINEETFEGEPEEEDYSGYTGNEGVTATHLYRRTVRLIV